MSNNPQKIHICLVSAQILANLIPVLMDKPNKVILVATETMLQNGMSKRFQDILKKRNIKHEVYEKMPSTNMPDIYHFALETSDEIQKKYPNAELILNATGGTKLMSQGFIEVMEDDAQIIYTDTQHNRLEYLGKSKLKDSQILDNVLDIETYLKAYGANYKQALSDNEDWKETIASRKSITKYLGNHASEIEGLVRNLNYLVSKALTEDELLAKPVQHLSHNPRKEWQAALKKLNDTGLLKWTSGTEVTFIDEEKTRYIGGIWLEEYVYHIASDEKPNDIASGVKVSWDNSKKTHNELDLVIVHNNRMLIMECKTMRYGKSTRKDADVLYKIDSLGDDLKGLYGQLWLVNAQNTKDNMQDRAKDRHITIIEPSELKNLRKRVCQWMDG